MGLYSPKFKKWFAGLMIGWFAFVASAGFFVMNTQSTMAQEPSSGGEGAEAAAEAAGAQPPESEPGEAAETANDFVGQKIVAGLIVSGMQVLEFALERLAHSAAKAILEGGKGRGGLFHSETAAEAWETYGKEVAGEALGRLSENVVGDALDSEFDLCAPQLPSVQAGIQFSLIDTYDPPAPKCEWRSISSNWEGFVASARDRVENPDKYLLQGLARGFSPSQNELSASISMQVGIAGETAEKQQIDLFEQMSNDGYKDLTDAISGNIKTPASTLQETFESRLKKAEEGKIDLAQEGLLEGAKLGQAGTGLVVNILSVFIRTLAGGWIQKALQEGLFESTPPPDPLNPEFAALNDGGGATATESRMVTRNPISLTNHNALGEFITCPTGQNVTNRKVNNCVMDQSFFAAVSEGQSGNALTIQEAIDQGLLKGGWPLIPPKDEVRNQDPLCYTYGYCHSNLVKLRKARVIPVGWEIAARLAGEGASGDQLPDPPSLQEVVNNFDNCPDEDGTGGSKWCHLIDPNWVLKYPETQCRATTSGEILASSMGGVRAESCVDTPSCIEEDKDGNCIGGYGYCTRERNTWEFRGDACEPQFASCLAFENTRNGQSGNFLLNTVDFSICGEGNAGCRWYRTNKYVDDGGTPNDASDDTYEWLPENNSNTNIISYDVATWDNAVRFDGSSAGSATMNRYAYQDRAYFNKNVEECSSSAAGCTEMYEVDGGLNLNLIANPSFEDDTDNNDAPDRWRGQAGSNYSTDGSNSNFGASSVSGSPTVSWEQDSIRLAPNSFYTLSYYAQGSGSASVNVRFTTTEGQWSQTLGDALAQTTADADCRALGGNTPQGWAVDAAAGDLEQDAFNRFDCTFTTLSQPLLANVEIAGDSGVYYDAVQLQLGEVATSFTDGYDVGQPQSAYLRMPPDYLGCTGSPDDPDACDNYAQVCTQQDVGCNMYTPEDGDPSVPAVTSEIDNCPAECVGYASYKQEPTRYESADSIPFPQYFIADTAESCSQENVGCDGFTNLDAVDAGGEGLEYYTDLRTCQKPEDTQNERTYFTWQGSEQAGYQLRTWNLLESNQSGAPCIAGEQGSRTSISCNETGSYNNTFCDEPSDTIVNPDCREFIDEDGISYFRLLSETVLIDEQCSTYRKNESDQQSCTDSGGYWDTTTAECFYLGLAEESDSCPAEEASCRAYTGSAGRNAATLINETFEGGTYQDFESYDNANIVISNESIATDGLSLRVANGGFETLHESITNACAQTDGCQGDPNGCTIEEGETSCGLLKDTLVAGKTFTVNFWAQGNGDIDVQFVEDGGAGTAHSFTDGDLVTLNENWRQYTIGPLNTADLPNFDEDAVLRIAPDGANASTLFFIDNLELNQSDEVIPLIKNSWTTPSTCDQAPNGTEAPQYYLGCEAYTDQDGEQANLYQFSRLCSEEVVGCSAFYDTQNTESPYGQTYNARCSTDDGAPVSASEDCTIGNRTYCEILAGNSDCTFDIPGEIPAPLPSNGDYRIELGPSAVTISNDVPTYLVDDGSARCGAADAGCTAMGVPEYNLDKTAVESFSEGYFIDDPDTYEDTLCKADALFCEEWSSTDDGNFYFKDPAKKRCEFEEGITIDGRTFNGWFRQGTNEPCDWTDTNGNGVFDVDVDTSYLIGGSRFGVWNNGDPNYEGWVATCPSSANRCTAFVDPTDTQDGEKPAGTPYIYLNDERMSEDRLAEEEKCNGSVSRKEGCVLFNNRNIPELNYNASASYIASKHADRLFGDGRFSKQDPIDCSASTGGAIDPADDELPPLNLCESMCRYDLPSEDVDLLAGSERERNVASLNSEYRGSCLVDSDCPPLQASDGQDYNGICIGGADSDTENLAVPALQNDTNSVVKVNRDRECAEWLTCKSSIPSFDPRTSTWVNKCDDIGLCTEYDATGNSSRCAEWSDSDPEVLSAERYQQRDVSWTGLEYAGYSIPNQLPVDQYEEVDLREPRVGGYCSNDPSLTCEGPGDATTCPGGATCQDTICKEVGSSCDANNPCADPGFECNFEVNECEKVVREGSDGTVVLCSDNTDCDVGNNEECREVIPTDPEPDVRLAHVVGACNSDDIERGGTCEVGYCEDEPELNCGSDAACPTGECITTVCRDGNTGEMITDAGGDVIACAADADCGTGEVCSLANNARSGSCFNNKCLQNIRGESVETRDQVVTNVEPKACRGYPEGDSPYSAELVTSWKVKTEDGQGDPAWEVKSSPMSHNAIASSLPQLFQNVNTCGLEPGGDPSDCMCSYAKLEYGGASTGFRQAKYYDIDSRLAQQDLNQLSVCVGGEFSGSFCEEDSECGEGTCETPERKDTFYGWDGYCLERDGAINLFNEPGENPCLTWYPVDQLSGSTDIFAKYTEAGFEPRDGYMCTGVADTYGLRTTDYACAESAPTTVGFDPCPGPNNGNKVVDNWFAGNNDGPQDQGEYAARESVFCPEGYFAVMTGCGGNNNHVGAPKVNNDRICTQGDNDYPYFCVPKLSYHTKDKMDSSFSDDTSGDIGNLDFKAGDPCLPPDVNRSSSEMEGLYPYAHAYKNFGEVSFGSGGDEVGLHKEVYAVHGSQFLALNDFYRDCETRGLSRDTAIASLAPFSKKANAPIAPPDKMTTNKLNQAFNEISSSGDLQASYVVVAPYVYTALGVSLAALTNDTGWYRLKVPIDVKTSCTEISQVSSISLQDGRYNAAWTDRVWEGGSDFTIDSPWLNPADRSVQLTGNQEPRDQRFEYEVGQEEPPFGMFMQALLNGNPVYQYDPYPQFVEHCEFTFDDGNGNTIRRFTVMGNSDNCPPSTAPQSASNATQHEGGPLNAAPYQDLQIDARRGFQAEKPESITLGGLDTPTNIEGSGREQQDNEVAARVGQVFAESLGYKLWKDGVRQYVKQNLSVLGVGSPGGPDGLDMSFSSQAMGNNWPEDPLGGYSPVNDEEDIPDGLQWNFSEAGDEQNAQETGAILDTNERPDPPEIWSVGSCGGSSGTECREGRSGAVSLNGIDEGTINGGGEKQVSMRFFTAANENQMPIRNIIADWGDAFDDLENVDPGDYSGDPVGSLTKDNFYKNHRGYTSGQSLCDPNSFAGADRACENSYVTFTNNYICTEGLVQQMSNTGRICQVDSNGKLVNSPCTGGPVVGGEGACVFQPRVSVKDNWGWCTGECPGGTDGTDDCYDGTRFGAETPTDGRQNECDWRNCPGDDCGTDADPWIYYDGFVVVEP
jgi:hypothetical protein